MFELNFILFVGEHFIRMNWVSGWLVWQTSRKIVWHVKIIRNISVKCLTIYPHHYYIELDKIIETISGGKEVRRTYEG